MIEYSAEDLHDLVSRVLAPQYYRWKTIRDMDCLESYVNEALLWYYQPMRNGEQRLAHYLSTCESKKHFENLIKLSLCEFIPGLMRLNSYKNNPDSLNKRMSPDDDTEFIDMLEDKAESLDVTITTRDILSILTPEERNLVKDLMETGYEEEKQQMIQENRSERSIKRRLNPIDLHIKYENYDILIKGIRSKITNYYVSSGAAGEFKKLTGGLTLK